MVTYGDHVQHNECQIDVYFVKLVIAHRAKFILFFAKYLSNFHDD